MRVDFQTKAANIIGAQITKKIKDRGNNYFTQVYNDIVILNGVPYCLKRTVCVKMKKNRAIQIYSKNPFSKIKAG